MKGETVTTFNVGGVTIHAGRLPSRKRPCLIEDGPGGMRLLASFACAEDADSFNGWLAGLADIVRGAAWMEADEPVAREVG